MILRPLAGDADRLTVGSGQFGGQVRRRVAGDGEPRAVFRAVSGESRQDDGAAAGQRGAQGGQVGTAVVWTAEEVEDGPVVPDLVGALRPPVEEVCLHPGDSVAAGAGAGGGERRR